MSFALPSLNVETICVLGIGGALLGLCGLMFGPVLRGRGRLVAVVALLAGWAVGVPVALALSVDPVWWLPPLALLTAAQALALLRSPWLERSCVAVLHFIGRPRVHAGLFVAASPLLMLGYAEWVNSETDTTIGEEFLSGHETALALDSQPIANALTDAGRTLPLFAVLKPEPDAPPRKFDESSYFQKQHLQFSVIRNETPSEGTNCHGWVFTGGRFWLRGGAVELVLEDNGYSQATAPAFGDLVVYRDEEGTIAHSGIVCGFTNSHEVLVESKWGHLGRYVHTADKHCYPNTTHTYYHSARGSHLLHGLSAPSPASESRVAE